MQNFSDRDIAYDLLYTCKAAAAGGVQAVLESAHPRCREIFHRHLDEDLRSQWKIWRFLHNRAEYRVQPAERREIDGIRQRMEHLARSHQVDGGRAAWNSGDGARWEERDDRPNESNAQRAAGWGYASGGVNFEPGRNLPDETRFEAEHGFAGGEDGGRRFGTAAGGDYAYGAERARYGNNARYGAVPGSRSEAGHNWNQRQDRTGRAYGENAWAAEGANRGGMATPRY